MGAAVTKVTAAPHVIIQSRKNRFYRAFRRLFKTSPYKMIFIPFLCRFSSRKSLWLLALLPEFKATSNAVSKAFWHQKPAPARFILPKR